MEKIRKFGGILLLIGIVVTWISGSLLLGIYQYQTTLFISTGLISFLVGIALALVGLLFVNRDDDPFFRAAGWFYTGTGLVIFLLAIGRLSLIFDQVTEVGFERLQSPAFLMQIITISAAFVLVLLAYYMILRGTFATTEKKEEVRRLWRHFRISSVLFLLMKILLLVSEPLWQEAMLRANMVAGDTVLMPGVTAMPFDVSFFTSLEWIFSVLLMVATIWMVIAFIRLFVPTVRTLRSRF